MRLQQISETTDTMHRYDADTVRQILVRATELEQTKQDRLSAMQVEELGRELGLSPETIRQAIGEVERGTVTGQTTQLQNSSVNREFVEACRPGIIYAIVLTLIAFFITKTHAPIDPPLGIILYFVPPFVLAMTNARRQRSFSLGVISGMITMFLALIAITIGFQLAEGHQGIGGDDFMSFILVMIAAGGFAGVVGGYARRWQESQQAKQRLAQQR